MTHITMRATRRERWRNIRQYIKENSGAIALVLGILNALCMVSVLEKVLP